MLDFDEKIKAKVKTDLDKKFLSVLEEKINDKETIFGAFIFLKTQDERAMLIKELEADSNKTVKDIVCLLTDISDGTFENGEE